MGVFVAEGSMDGKLTSDVLLRSTGVNPRLRRISALFVQNSSMRSIRFKASSEEGLVKESVRPAGLVKGSLARGVEVMTGLGCRHTGGLEVTTSVEGKGWEHIGEVGDLRGRRRGGIDGDFTGDVGVTSSCVGVGWEQTGETGVKAFGSDGVAALLPLCGM